MVVVVMMVDVLLLAERSLSRGYITGQNVNVDS